MRPRRFYVTSLNEVTISRSSESVTITYRNAAVCPVVFAIRTDIDRLDDSEILARFNDSLRTSRALTEGRRHVVVEFPRSHPQPDYFAPAGQWVPRGGIVRCFIDDGPGGELVIYDHRLSLRDFGGLLRTYAGWRMRITFVEDDEAEPPLVEVRDLGEGEAAHAWR
jgi:hypothetical protein